MEETFPADCRMGREARKNYGMGEEERFRIDRMRINGFYNQLMEESKQDRDISNQMRELEIPVCGKK